MRLNVSPGRKGRLPGPALLKSGIAFLLCIVTILSAFSQESAEKEAVAAVTASQNNTYLFVENLDQFPSNDLLVFSRIQVPWTRDKITYNANHDSITLRIHSEGINSLTISKLTLSNNSTWQIAKLKGKAYSSSALPLTLSPGTYADLVIKFIALNQAERIKILHETLTIISNDDASPSKVVSLSGIWQRYGEGNREPTGQEILDAFGMKISTGFGQTDPDKGVPGTLRGDQISSTYFVRADNSKPVFIRQMAAYHGCCYSTEKVQWFVKGTTTFTTIATQIVPDGQMALGYQASGAGVGGTFSPTGAFGFNAGFRNTTDPLINPGKKIGIKVWKAFDGSGNIIPNAYILGSDYLGTTSTNYDYNDNMYFVSNLKPETGSAFFSALSSNPSDLDFGEKVLKTSNFLQLSLFSLGKTYPNGSKDPVIKISSVSVTGNNKSEFSAGLPASTTLNPGQSTTLTVKFNPASEGLKIADLLVYYNNSKSPYRVPLYGIAKLSGTTVTANFRINSGSPNSVTLDGKTWSADNKYAHDNLEPFINSKLTQIACTDEDALYLKEQSSNGDKKPFRYEIPIANGNYAVRLHFAELYWGAPGAGLAGGEGARVFSVKLENQYRLVNFDMTRQAGGATAIIKNFAVTVSDGKLNIDFSANQNRPMVCAVEVYHFSSGAAKPDTIAATAPEIPVPFDNSLISLEFPKIFPNPLHNDFTVQFPNKYEGNCTIQLSDILGRTYETQKTLLKAGGSSIRMDVSKYSLKAGVYFLSVQLEGSRPQVYKLLVE